jgi:hypothetical protein
VEGGEASAADPPRDEEPMTTDLEFVEFIEEDDGSTTLVAKRPDGELVEFRNVKVTGMDSIGGGTEVKTWKLETATRSR